MSQGEIGRVSSERDEAEASLQAARATLNLAKLKLDSTKITAPIRGKVSRPQLAEGNLVVADTTVLATIDSSDPIYVGFDVDERTVLRLNRERREGKAKPGLEAGLPVLIGLADEEGYPRKGKIDSVDIRFDPSKGTLHCRAVVTNSDGLMIPGLFARVRLVTSALSQALLVPEGAVLTDRGRNFLFVVDDQKVIELRSVVLGQSDNGLRVVKDGLKVGEWIMVHDGGSAQPEKASMPPGSTTNPLGPDSR